MTTENKSMIKNLLNAIILQNTPESIADILSIIENPFINRASSDIPSLIFHRFYKNTDVPAALPLFSFFAVVSAWCVQNKATYRVPLAGDRVYELDTWIMALAPSGTAKTLSMGEIVDLIPINPETNQPVVAPNFDRPNGPAAMVQQLQNLPGGRGFWVQDEASQLFKLVEQPGHPMAEIKEFLLKMKDHKSITRITKDDEIKTDPIVMTQFFINTIDSMAKAISEESLRDGTMRRYQFALANRDERKFGDFALYDLDKISDEILQKAMYQLFSQNISENVYTFNDECFDMYTMAFKMFWEKQYSKFMEGSESLYRTYMMEAWKYAIYHHLIHGKPGKVIDEYSLQWGLKVSMYLLNSLQNFLLYRLNATKEDIENQTDLVTKVKAFIIEHEDKPGFAPRAVYRKFNMKKDDLVSILRALRNQDKKFKSSLYEKLKLDKAKK
jgi:hypothetical protein